MTKKIVKLTESEDVKDAATEAKQPARKSRKSGTVVENAVSPQGIEVANVITEPLNARRELSSGRYLLKPLMFLKPLRLKRSKSLRLKVKLLRPNVVRRAVPMLSPKG